MIKKFFLTSRHGFVGTNVMFHAKDKKGYTSNISNAHLFSLDECNSEILYNSKSIGLLSEEVINKSILSVDMQYLNDIESKGFSSETFVIQINGTYNGNDIGFIVCDQYDDIYNLSFAEEFTKDEAEMIFSIRDNVTIWPKKYLESISRKTFQEHNIDINNMALNHGIKYKVKKSKKKSKNTFI